MSRNRITVFRVLRVFLTLTTEVGDEWLMTANEVGYDVDDRERTTARRDSGMNGTVRILDVPF